MNEMLDNRPMPIVVVGHVDHGKSTLVGRLLYDTDSLPDGKYEEVEAACQRRGVPMELSFLMDVFQAERDQAVTIDTTQIWFSTKRRQYVMIDAPGHREFLKNMLSGAAQADAAILVVDAKEGVQEQTKRHAYLLSLLGVRQVAVVLNKMDLVYYDQAVFERVSQEITAYLKTLHIRPNVIIPISAREGVMVTERAEDALDWYVGPILTEALDSFIVDPTAEGSTLRFPVQDVYRFDERRVLVGRVESGSISVGDEVFFSPANESAKVTSIEVWPEDKSKQIARTGESVGITLDQPLFVERGQFCTHADKLPMLSNVFRTKIFWLGKKPLKVGESYKLRIATFETQVSVQSIDVVVDTDDLKHQDNPQEVPKNGVAEVTFRAHEMLALDPYEQSAKTGRAVFYEDFDIVGGGLISMDGYADQRQHAPKSENIYKVDSLISKDIRSEIKGHNGGVFWFTGLSGAGKSTLAMAVEEALTQKGYHTYVLDGDNVRYGLNSDLGFSPKDRAENIRRIGEVAGLMADAGLIVLSAFISPYRADRDRARAVRPDSFHEVYVHADLATCEERDPKGLYKKARSGEIQEFTGIDAPYEAPVNPELVVRTDQDDVQACVDKVLRYIGARVERDIESHQAKEKLFSA